MTLNITDPSFFSPEESQIIEKIWAINHELKSYFIQRDEVIDTMFIGLLCRQHALLIGPPGTAKSSLIEKFTQSIEGYHYFYWQLKKQTNPEELFGPYSIEELKKGKYQRVPTGKFQEAEVVYLDEVFNGNSAILNAMNSAMNERVFEGDPIPLEVIYGATNHIPKKGDQAAYFDRFLLRMFIGYIHGEEWNFLDLLTLEDYVPMQKLSKTEIDILRQKMPKVSIHSISSILVKLWQFLRAENIHPSDRRWRWCVRALQARALLDGRKEVIEDDLDILKYILWTEKREIKMIEATIMKTISPVAATIQELYSDAVQIDEELKILDPEETEDKDKISEGLNKLKTIGEEISEITEKQGISSKVKDIAERLTKQINKIYVKNLESKLGIKV